VSEQQAKIIFYALLVLPFVGFAVGFFAGYWRGRLVELRIWRARLLEASATEHRRVEGVE
jgi:hypothetical protein